ncbi:NUDIX domain-containing protein [Devosia sp. FKR38]|uniref:NUDIX domain-containing protein n=1 Tax=Devosia sp. FKR38 TaxID=2562312 RepID=UPI0010C053F9|nr:NUDIX domain-containing protein [Devosia sp. FKR38]
MSKTVTIHSVTKLSHNWGRFDDYQVSHGTRDGGLLTITREIYDHGSSAAVLLYAPEAGTVILTRQFRLPAHLNGDEAWLIEVPAGMLDGEAPEAAAQREALEETGYAPRDLIFVCNAYSSPGSLTEKCACFIARYTQGQKPEAGGGLAAEGEDIEVLEMSLESAMAMVGSGEIVDAKTILLLQALMLRLAAGPLWAS